MSKVKFNFDFLNLLSEKYGFELLDDYSLINVNSSPSNSSQLPFSI